MSIGDPSLIGLDELRRRELDRMTAFDADELWDGDISAREMELGGLFVLLAVVLPLACRWLARKFRKGSR